MIGPHCHNKIAWPKVVLITQWSNLRCETCGYQWNRKYRSWQNFLVGIPAILMAFPIPFIAASKGLFVGLLYFLAVLVLVALIDAKTIYLVPPVVRKTSKLE
jgi:prepilin signal peptidase PulO-like enzyme (type II secretory pathway)